MVNAAFPARNGFHGGLNLNVGPQTADSIVHLTARHELRANFRLASAASAVTTEISMPGSHGDVGGSTWDEQTQYQATFADRERLIAEGRLAPGADTDWVIERRHHESTFDPQTGNPGTSWDPATNVPLRLAVRPGLSKLSLHRMHRLAQGSGVALHALPAEHRPPPAFNHLLGGGINPEDPLFRPYINPSSRYWDPVSHPEDDLIRDIDANFPQQGSPNAPPQ